MKIHKFGVEGRFRDRVVAVVRGIPKGKTMSYKEVAARAGSPNAARAVGSVMRRVTDPSVPCHRVVRSNGSVRKSDTDDVGRERERVYEKEAASPHA
ncbi:MGMT family protein [Candidatus Uhrbacteria bacterium]|nr:MGMT family protein [Candidatus Uhrbacteria bacterium]